MPSGLTSGSRTEGLMPTQYMFETFMTPELVAVALALGRWNRNY